MAENDKTINNRVRWENYLDPSDIRGAYKKLYWDDFCATIAAWGISVRRVSRLFGKRVGQRYKRHWAYDKRFCTR